MNPRPAWKEPMVWLIAGLPITAVIAGLVTVWIASSNADAPLKDQFRKEGLTIQQSAQQSGNTPQKP